MQQLLKLVKKGDRFAPTVYQFGANEHLNIHRADQYADLTDAATGACIRIIGWQGLRDMGYSPANLLDCTGDQRLASVSFIHHLRDCTKQIALGLTVALSIAIIGSITGCNSYLLSQLDQDIATSTIEPRLATESVNQDDLDDDTIYKASKRYRNGLHANRFLASNRGVK